MGELRCKRCGIVILGRKRKFCNRRCQTAYHSLMRYNMLKDKPSYKKERKEYYKKWVNNNRERFNKHMRLIMRKRNQIPVEKYRVKTEWDYTMEEFKKWRMLNKSRIKDMTYVECFNLFKKERDKR